MTSQLPLINCVVSTTYVSSIVLHFNLEINKLLLYINLKAYG